MLTELNKRKLLLGNVIEDILWQEAICQVIIDTKPLRHYKEEETGLLVHQVPTESRIVSSSVVWIPLSFLSSGSLRRNKFERTLTKGLKQNIRHCASLSGDTDFITQYWAHTELSTGTLTQVPSQPYIVRDHRCILLGSQFICQDLRLSG